MRIRQVALVARDLEPVAATLCDILRIGGPFRDPGVEAFGLHNVVLPIGDTFLEVVSPFQPDTAAGRYLERRGGDGGYMVLVQSDDLDSDRKRLAELGVRVVWNVELDDIGSVHLHPRDTGGAILSLDQPRPPAAWRWGGPDWQRRGAESAEALVAVELQSDDPAALAHRWSAILGQTVQEQAGRWVIETESGHLRFVAAQDGRGEGLGGIDLKVADAEKVVAAARTRGLTATNNQLEICGTRFRLV